MDGSVVIGFNFPKKEKDSAEAGISLPGYPNLSDPI
jgi:hypothetical protein